MGASAPCNARRGGACKRRAARAPFRESAQVGRMAAPPPADRGVRATARTSIARAEDRYDRTGVPRRRCRRAAVAPCPLSCLSGASSASLASFMPARAHSQRATPAARRGASPWKPLPRWHAQSRVATACCRPRSRDPARIRHRRRASRSSSRTRSTRGARRSCSRRRPRSSPRSLRSTCSGRSIAGAQALSPRLPLRTAG